VSGWDRFASWWGSQQSPLAGLAQAFPQPLNAGQPGQTVAQAAPPPTSLTPSQWDALGAFNFGATQSGGSFPWRPLADVAAEVPKAVPPHVLGFGDYMAGMADKAAGPGLSPRDLIKAFTVTRSSIQRGAMGADKLRESWPDFQGAGKVRPEDAFSAWLETPTGKAYLDAAETGQVHSGAIDDAVAKLGGFGKSNDLRQALQQAPQVGGQAAPVSGMVAAARDAPGEGVEAWRDWTRGVPGIGPAKSGFIASLLGRGDQPTLDARQVLLQTGRPTAEVKNYLSNPRKAFPLVDELAERQRQLNLEMPQGMEPFRQHLTHHTLWDAYGGDTTTHGNVVRAMRYAGFLAPAAVGGAPQVPPWQQPQPPGMPQQAAPPSAAAPQTGGWGQLLDYLRHQAGTQPAGLGGTR
jgi:hypothetical protein